MVADAELKLSKLQLWICQRMRIVSYAQRGIVRGIVRYFLVWVDRQMTEIEAVRVHVFS